MGEVIKLRVASSQEAITIQSASGSLAVEAVSPRVSFAKVSGGTRLDITDVDGTKSAILPDGAAGPIGPVGPAGSDGVSPAASVTQTETGAVVTVTDANGTTTATLTHGPVGPQGERGPAGQNGSPGAAGNDGTTFTPSVSSEGVISWINDGGKTNPQSVNIRGPKGDDYVLTAEDKAEIGTLASEEAEAWAVGKRNGQDVESTDPTYQNNAKYWSDHAFSTTPEGYADLVEDVSELKSAISDAKAETNSGIIPLNLIPNTYINGNGAETYYANWSSTDFLDVIPSGKLHVTALNKLTYNAFYDENKSFISGGTFTINVGDNDISVPSTAYFCRLSGATTSMQNVVVFTDLKATLIATEEKTGFYHNIIDKQIDVKKNNAYENCALTSGRVFKGVFDSTISTMKCTDYIQLIPKHRYAVYGGFLDNNYRYYFDTSKKVIGVLPYVELLTTYPYTQSSNHMIFTAPDDAGYIRINFLTASVSGDTVPDGFYFVDITDSVTASTKLLVIGDSISTDYYGGYAKWVTDLISEGYFLHPNVKNDSIHATGFVARYSQSTDDTFLARLSTYNQANFDWVVLFGGINDFIQSVDFDTFKSAVDTYFAYLTANFYNKKLCVFSPLRTATTTANSAGHIQQDYADYIKSVAKSYAIPVLNLTEESGFFPFVEVFKNQWTLLPEGSSVHDGVHPTEAWEKQFLVPIVKDFFKRFYE